MSDTSRAQKQPMLTNLHKIAIGLNAGPVIGLRFWTFCPILFAQYNFQSLYGSQKHCLLYLPWSHTCMSNILLLLRQHFSFSSSFHLCWYENFFLFYNLSSKEMELPIFRRVFPYQELNSNYQRVPYDGSDQQFLEIFFSSLISLHRHKFEDNLAQFCFTFFHICSLEGLRVHWGLNHQWLYIIFCTWLIVLFLMHIFEHFPRCWSHWHLNVLQK